MYSKWKQMASKAVIMSAGLIVVGLLLAGYGVAGVVISDNSLPCGTLVSVDQDPDTDLPQTQFADLTEREKQLFKEALSSDGFAHPQDDRPIPSGFEKPRIVTYQGEQYRVGLISNDGCISPLDDIRGIPTAGGPLLLVGGIYGMVTTRHNSSQ